MGSERKINFFADLLQDLRYGLRTLAKNPAFTTIAVLALALGIGANSAIFSVVDAVLLRPLPFKNPNQLVMLWENAAHLGFPRDTPSPANFLDWQKQATSFTGMAAMSERSFNLTGVGEPERLEGTACFRKSLRIVRRIGPAWTHVRTGGRQAWYARCPPQPLTVATTLRLRPRRHRPRPHSQWRELHGRWSHAAASCNCLVSRTGTISSGCRLHFQRKKRRSAVIISSKLLRASNPDVTLKQAQAEMDTIAARLEQQYPTYNTRRGAVVIPLHEQVVGEIRPALLILLGAVGFVLLIACANVANLLLARAAVRQKEIALRLALGASRSRLTRQFLTESVLLALFGAGLGLLLAWLASGYLRTFIPVSISQVETITIDGRVLIFTLLVALVTGIAFGLVPAIQGSHFNLNDTLKEGGRDSGGGSKGNRVRSLLVIGEVAVSFVLLIGAGLLINSFFHLRNLDPGFRSDHLLTMKVNLSEVKYPDRERRAAFFDEVMRRVRELPGVQSAAVAGNLPLTYNGDSMSISVEGVPDPPPGQQPDVIYRAIGPGYFAQWVFQSSAVVTSQIRIRATPRMWS